MLCNGSGKPVRFILFYSVALQGFDMDVQRQVQMILADQE